MPFMTINGRNLHYTDQGEGFPILFGHSFLWDERMWAPQLKVLSQQYRCLVVDLWDHGQSDHLHADQYTMKQLADDYWQFTQSLGLEKFAVVGLSVGGMWGVQLTLDHPEAVSALAILDTYVGAEPEVTQKKYLAMMADMVAKKGVSEELANIIAPIFFSPKTGANNPQMVRALKAHLMALPAENIPGIVTLGKMIFTRDCLLERLPEIKQPTLVIVGADDIPRTLSEAKYMADRLDNGTLAVINDAGHIANLEQPDEVTNWLSSFIEKYVDYVPRRAMGMRP
jgi:pimeloyl-ACP methyl ester carboxylesterase